MLLSHFFRDKKSVPLLLQQILTRSDNQWTVCQMQILSYSFASDQAGLLPQWLFSVLFAFVSFVGGNASYFVLAASCHVGV